jgi:large subunit ribosomal protein L18
LIDDDQGKTMATVSSLKLDGKRMPNGGNVSTAKEIGKAIAEAAKKQGIESVVFDRNGYLYHGRIKALAESVREAGLKF